MHTDKDISVRWDASTNVSTITSPCFDKENRSPLNHGGSLFSRLSAQMTSPQMIEREHGSMNKPVDGGDLVIGSPTESIPNPSPIHMSDSIFEYQSHTKLEDSCYKSFATHATPSKESNHHGINEDIKTKSEFRDLTQSVKSNKSQRERILSLLNALESHDPIAAMNDSFHHCLDIEKQERKSTAAETRENRSVNTALKATPASTKATTNGKPLEQINSANVSVDTSCHLNSSKSTHQTCSSSKRDEWKEVIDVESGRKYYYNRKTRVSKWKLPKGAVLAKKKVSDKCQQSFDMAQRSHSIQNSDLSIQKDNRSFEKIASNESSSEAIHPSSAKNNDEWPGPFAKGRQPVNNYSNDMHSFPQVDERFQYLKTDETSFQSPMHNVSHESVATATHFKSPQDCGLATSEKFFCMFCGMERSLTALGPHLSQCSFKKVDLFSHRELMKVIVDSLSAMEGSPKSIETSNDYNRDVNCTTYSNSATNESHGWDTAVEEESISYEGGRSNSIKQQYQRKHVEVYAEIEVKTCPFCRDVFNKGNQFSGHLLKCPERKKGRNRRRAKKIESQDISCPRTLVERKRHTPGRKLPWE